MNTLEHDAAANCIASGVGTRYVARAVELRLVLIGAERCDLAGEDILYVGGVS